MTSTLRGGKTAPRLLEALKLYNPQALPTNQFNVLTEFLPQFSEKAPYFKSHSKRACVHEWALKTNQCSATLVDGADRREPAQVAAFCLLCRSHLSIIVDYSGGNGLKPCPQDGAPLHHFVYDSHNSPGFGCTDSAGPVIWEDRRVFRCSVQTCRAKLKIFTHSCVLKNEWAGLLVDKDLISQRANAAIASDSERFEGHTAPTATEVISTLRSYIANSMKGDVRRINRNNKRFLLCLGDSCSDLLLFLGFSRQEEDWVPPRPIANASVPFENDLNIVLDNVDKELLFLLDKQSEAERRGNSSLPLPIPATNELQGLLGCKNYQKIPSSRTIDLTEEESEHPFYESLGAMLTFHDDLIAFCYDQQLQTDSDNTPYYLECLQGIAKGRGSEELQEKSAIESSLGRVSLAEIRDSFRELGIDMSSLLTDDHIIGTFQSRISDAGKSQEGILKRALNIIGQYRHSDKILQYASDTISTYEQALAWLGASKEMDESFITSMYSVKVGENEANEPLARKCVEKIAEERNSTALRSWLVTGQLDESEMNPTQAYARLNIQHERVDDEMVLAAFKSGVQDAPSQLADLTRALRAIAKQRNSKSLLQTADSSGAGKKQEYRLDEWPVGLENIGNTCYLNSLLQFYFSVRPLRDLVLNIDEYKMVLEPGALKSKRVGSRPVTKNEIERAQQFVSELKKLFESMIIANKRQITPERQLARLTLVSPSDDDQPIRRFSTVSGARPDPEDVSGKVVQIDLTKNTDDGDVEAIKGADEAISVSLPTINGIPPKNGYSSSEGTLVGASRPGTPIDNDFMVIDSSEKQQQVKALENKENLAPTKSDLTRPITPDADSMLQPLEESSPSRINEQGPKDIDLPKKEKANADKLAPAAPDPPTRPPPVPPRKGEDIQNAMMQETEEYARQQDVTEVIGNVLFQLQCAIRAKSVDADGEQLDEIKELFFGKMKIIMTDSKGEIRTKEEFFSDLKINVHSGPQDIYAAIDASLDKQMVTVGETEEPQYTTISQLPEILQIYPNRTGYDRARSLPFKVNHHLEFKDVIYMDRYLDTDDPDLKHRRDECWSWKEELRSIQDRQEKLQKTPFDLEMAETLKLTAKYVHNVGSLDEAVSDAPPRLSEAIQSAASNVAVELETLNNRAAHLSTLINAQFAGFTRVPYRLHAVFIHRGVVTSGHYWVYIYDFEGGLWRKYNDGYVTAVDDPQHEIFSTENSERPATPMFLVYVKEGLETSLVQAVRREPREEDPGISGAGEVEADAMEGVQLGTVDESFAEERLGNWAAGGGWAGDENAKSDGASLWSHAIPVNNETEAGKETVNPREVVKW